MKKADLAENASNQGGLLDFSGVCKGAIRVRSKRGIVEFLNELISYAHRKLLSRKVLVSEKATWGRITLNAIPELNRLLPWLQETFIHLLAAKHTLIHTSFIML